MNIEKKWFLTFVFPRIAWTCLVVLSSSVYSQDLIIRKDSSKIFCKILREDSSALYYQPARDNTGKETKIEKREVIKSFSTSRNAKMAKERYDNAERIWNAKSYKTGLYKYASQFIINTPFDTSEFVVEKRSLVDLMVRHGGEYTFKMNSAYVDPSDVYGFCDGKDVYINYDHPKGFCKMEYVGPYTFFTYVFHGTGVISIVPGQLTVIDKVGEFHGATPKYLKKIFKLEYPELAVLYAAEKNPRSVRKDYLIKLNKYLCEKK